jgi:hypothetical protein
LPAIRRLRASREGAFDLVIAANVPHATADLRETMSHARLPRRQRRRRLVEAGAAALARHHVRHDRRLVASRDTDLRGGHPLITGDEWIRVLDAVGFVEPAAVPGSARGGMVDEPWASQAIVWRSGLCWSQGDGSPSSRRRDMARVRRSRRCRRTVCVVGAGGPEIGADDRRR